MPRTLIQVRKNGQITLPVELRRKANLKKGDLFNIRVSDGVIYLVPLKGKTMPDLDEREKSFQRVQEIREATPGLPEEKVEAIIAKAVKKARTPTKN